MFHFSKLILLTFLYMTAVLANPDGAPDDSCNSMDPSHGVAPQTSTPPFTTNLDKVLSIAQI